MLKSLDCRFLCKFANVMTPSGATASSNEFVLKRVNGLGARTNGLGSMQLDDLAHLGVTKYVSWSVH